MDWDSEAELFYCGIRWPRVLLMLAAVAVSVGLIVYSAYDMFLPGNRQGIQTVEEFAENYRDYQTLLGNAASLERKESPAANQAPISAIYVLASVGVAPILITAVRA